jgi:hypothetical protein
MFDQYWAKPRSKSGNVFEFERDWCVLRGEQGDAFEISLYTKTRWDIGTKNIAVNTNVRDVIWKVKSLIQESRVVLTTGRNATDRTQLEAAIRGSALSLRDSRESEEKTSWILETIAQEQPLERPWNQLHVDRGLTVKTISSVLDTVLTESPASQ